MYVEFQLYHVYVNKVQHQICVFIYGLLVKPKTAAAERMSKTPSQKVSEQIPHNSAKSIQHTSGARSRQAYRVRKCASLWALFTGQTKASCSAFPLQQFQVKGGTILGIGAVSVRQGEEEETVAACRPRTQGKRKPC